MHYHAIVSVDVSREMHALRLIAERDKKFAQPQPCRAARKSLTDDENGLEIFTALPFYLENEA